MTVTLNPRLAVVMAYILAKYQGQRDGGSIFTVETDGWSDRQINGHA